MPDPLAEVVSLLQPRAPFAKHVRASGAWRVRRHQTGKPFYCALLEGQCMLEVDGHPPLTLQAGDFVLIPSAHGFTVSSTDPVPERESSPESIVAHDGQVRLGDASGAVNAEMMLGHCTFGSPDAALLVSLLPRLLHVRGEPRLATLVQLVREESRAMRPAREVVLERLLEVLLIEALRSGADADASAGLVRGLADQRLAAALRAIHAQPTRSWTVTQMAGEAALSRSAFFERFSAAVGVAPMGYLLAWRMTLAKDLLRRQDGNVARIAERVGYSSASAFSIAFARHVGMPPTKYPGTLDASERG